MRKTFSLPILSIAFIFCFSFVNLAQNREKFVISAKAGGINAITGEARVHGRGESDWQQLSITDDLDAGDRVRTANDGRVEILLNPGSYLRVGGDSEVELSNNTLENLEVRLLRGTAIVEATGADGLELNINISTPHTKLAIVRQGLYRLNVVPGDATELIVRKGRVILSDSHTKVKGGNKVVFSASTTTVAKLTKEEKKANESEQVEVWSKERAKTLARANSRISDRMMTSAFASFRDTDLFPQRMGLWFFNSHAGCYTFLPFFYGWGSPYGSSYTTSIYYPSGGYNPRPSGWSNNSSQPTGSTRPTYPSGGSTAPRPAAPTIAPPSGGFTREPRMMNPDSGRAMPRRPIQQPN